MGADYNFETSALCSYCRHAINTESAIYIFDSNCITEYDIYTNQIISCHKSPVENPLIKSIYSLKQSIYLQIVNENKMVIGEIALAGNCFQWKPKYATTIHPQSSIAIAYNNDKLCICYSYIIQNNKPVSIINVQTTCFSDSMLSNTYHTTHSTEFTFDANVIH